MPTIRRRFNQGVVTLAPHVVAGKSLACGQSVDVLLKGDFRPTHFGGFIDLKDLADGFVRVKIKGICAYSAAEDPLGAGFTLYCQKTLMLGAYDYTMNSVFLVLDHGNPIAWCAVPDSITH